MPYMSQLANYTGHSYTYDDPALRVLTEYVRMDLVFNLLVERHQHPGMNLSRMIGGLWVRNLGRNPDVRHLNLSMTSVVWFHGLPLRVSIPRRISYIMSASLTTIELNFYFSLQWEHLHWHRNATVNQLCNLLKRTAN